VPVASHAFSPEPRAQGPMTLHSAKRSCVAALWLALIAALPGCGQKGALYLPQKPQPVQPQTPETTTPQTPGTAPPGPDDGGQ
jgi:predicted small lipoprotein YifL